MFGARRRFIPSSMPFRPARKMDEAMRMQDALDMAVGTGNDALAREIADAIRASSVDPQVVGIRRALRALEREPMEVLPQRTFEDMGQDIGRSVRSYEGLRSGRTANLRNQPHAASAGMELRAAAEEAIQSAREARAAEQMGRAAATAGAGGLAAMIADSMDRMTPSAPGIRGVQSEAVDMEPMADMGMPEMTASIEDPIRAAAMDLDPTQVDLLRDDPMATADLVAESRPIPEDTPMIAIQEAVASEPRVAAKPARLTPEEIAALRGQVVDIRDAATGAPMDSFYPPESEEYKREQRMKLMYPQLRRR